MLILELLRISRKYKIGVEIEQYDIDNISISIEIISILPGACPPPRRMANQSRPKSKRENREIRKLLSPDQAHGESHEESLRERNL